MIIPIYITRQRLLEWMRKKHETVVAVRFNYGSYDKILEPGHRNGEPSCFIAY